MHAATGVRARLRLGRRARPGVIPIRRRSLSRGLRAGAFVLVPSEKSKQKGGVKDGKGMLQKTIDYFFASGPRGDGGSSEE